MTYTSHTQNGGYTKTLETPASISLYSNARLENHGVDDATTLTVDGANAVLDTRNQANYPNTTLRSGIISARFCPFDIYLGSDGTSATPSASTFVSAQGATVEDSAIGGSVTIENPNPIGKGAVFLKPFDNSQTGTPDGEVL